MFDHPYIAGDTVPLAPCGACGASQHQHAPCLHCVSEASASAHCAWCGGNFPSQDALFDHLGGEDGTSLCGERLSEALGA